MRINFLNYLLYVGIFTFDWHNPGGTAGSGHIKPSATAPGLLGFWGSGDNHQEDFTPFSSSGQLRKKSAQRWLASENPCPCFTKMRQPNQTCTPGLSWETSSMKNQQRNSHHQNHQVISFGKHMWNMTCPHPGAKVPMWFRCPADQDHQWCPYNVFFLVFAIWELMILMFESGELIGRIATPTHQWLHSGVKAWFWPVSAPIMEFNSHSKIFDDSCN